MTQTYFVQEEDVIQLLNTVEKELITLKKWFDVKKLSLNENKTKHMVFGGFSTNCDIKLSLHGVEIERVYETKK